MTTGLCDLNRAGRGSNVLPSRSVLYIADVVSGTASAYAVPFSSTQHVSGQFYTSEIIPVCSFPIRKVVAPTGGKKNKAVPEG
jgi:hypothetical protein